MRNEQSNIQARTDLLAGTPDLTNTDLWKETKAWFMRLHEPSFGQPSNAEHPNASPDGSRIAFTASTWHSLEDGSPKKSICLVDIDDKNENGQIQHVSQAPNSSKLPKWSPDGRMLGFLSDRLRKGHFLLYAMETEELGEARLLTPPTLNGVVQDFEWSADSTSLLVHVAPFGLPVAGAEGSGSLVESDRDSTPSWMPTVSNGKPSADLCSLWLWDFSGNAGRRISRGDKNVWSFCWCGTEQAILKVSEDAIGYSHQAAVLVKINLSNGEEEILRKKDDQMVGMIASAPSGSHVVVVESAGSERVKVVGKLALIDTVSKAKTMLPTNAVDIGYVKWTGADKIFAMGLRNLHSVALEISPSDMQVHDLWSTTDTCGAVNGFAQGCVVPAKGFATVRSSWTLAPEIGLVDTKSNYHPLLSFNHDGTKWLRSQHGDHQTISWKAPDGLEIHGLLYQPAKGTAPYRTILYVHGGPFSAVTDKWMSYNQWIPWLVAHGYAVLCPNFRGSVGRGAAFTNAVKGDIGGGDAQDLLSGLDHLIHLGLADEKRLGVIGGSYGGYMTSWLVTQTHRFAAAVASSPICDYKLQWICGDERIPILGEEIYVENSLAEQRSPLAHVQLCTTPTLVLAGTKDHCTPPQHAQYFHIALLDQGVQSVLAEYPREGHGVRLFPEVFDAYSRILNWFDTFV